MAQKRGKTAQLTYALKVSASSKDSFSCSCFSYTLNAITSISVPCVIFLHCSEYGFLTLFYFKQLILELSKIAYLLMNHLYQLQMKKIKLMMIKVGFLVFPACSIAWHHLFFLILMAQ